MHRKLIILAVGAAALAAIMFGFPEKKPKGKPAAGVPAPAPLPGQPATETGPVKELSPELREKQLAVLSKPCGRDPFSPSTGRSWRPDDMSLLGLKGICFKEGSMPAALVGDSIVREGDFVGKAQVVEIGRDYVRLKKGSQEYKLELDGVR